MSEEEKEKIKERIKELIRLLYRDDLSQFGKRNLETYINKLMEETGKVKQLEKENEALKEDNSHQLEERCRLTFELERLQKENKESKELYNKLLIGYNKLVQECLELEKVIDLMAEDIYDNDNFWKLKCAFEKVEKGKEKDYIKERFFEKAEEENE